MTYKLRAKLEAEEKERAGEIYEIRANRFLKEIEQLEEKNKGLKEKCMTLQRKATSSIEADFKEDIKLKINEFFGKKLGRKNMYILKEFNEKVLDVLAPSDKSKDKFAKLLRSFSSVQDS